MTFTFSRPAFRSSHRRSSVRKSVLRNFANFTVKKPVPESLFLNKKLQSHFLIKVALSPATLLKKKTLAQVFSCEFWEISKNAFFTEHVWATASNWNSASQMEIIKQYTPQNNLFQRMNALQCWVYSLILIVI